ncbi:MAG: hypothetical protein RI558_03400 [Psychroflexus sp.]|nr:hypothetical protein [Psychroflexus sp.]MDR9448143.1 hypothetical protein [Psychroflexus sp.]
MMKVILILLMLSTLSYAQTYQADEIKRFPLQADHFWGVDAYKDIYYSVNNVFYKKAQNADIDYVKEFKAFDLGPLYSVDLINPLKIVLFYQDSNTLVMLDNRLNELQRIEFNELQPLRTLAHAQLAGNRHVWLFNVNNQRLEVFDFTKNQTANLSLPVSADIYQMQANFKKAYLLSADQLFIYDWYANKIKSHSLEAQKIRLDGQQLVAYSPNNTYALLTDDFTIKPIQGIKEDSKSFYLADENLYIYTQNQLIIYRIKSKS